jgi:hypothetical protein
MVPMRILAMALCLGVWNVGLAQKWGKLIRERAIRAD